MSESVAPRSRRPSRLRAYLELLRLPNVFTAMADIALGYLLTHPTLEPWDHFALLLAASSALYLAGMVLNDVFDVEADRRERPERPIPSGRVTLAEARRLGWGLLAAGIGFGWLATVQCSVPRPGLIATALAALVLLYDRILKRTPLAPVAMGLCRMFNVLLGMSAAHEAWQPAYLLVALGLGVYIAGVTWFARTEARVSHRPVLAVSTAVMIAGLGLVAAYPFFLTHDDLAQPQVPDRWILFWLILGFLIVRRCLHAIGDPRPLMVQLAVKNCILSLVIIDAAAVWAARGTSWAVVTVLLLVPSLVLGRWLYST